MTRRWEFDALRGLMLVLMTLTHLPTRLTSPAGQPFGYVSAAEGFVFLSAFMAGMVYSRIGRREGLGVMQGKLLRRAFKVYLCQAAMLLFLFTVVAAIGLEIDRGAVRNLMSFYLHDPWAALLGGLTLVYQPPLLDILPLYVLFMLVSPWVLSWGMRRGWSAILAISGALWLAEQFGLGGWLHAGLVESFGLRVPLGETGAFATFAWQFLWMLGLWLGASQGQPAAEGAAPAPAGTTAVGRIPRWAVAVAAVLALIGLVWRHAIGQAPFEANVALNMVFDKWQLAPLRLLNMFALVVLAIYFGPGLVRRMPRPAWLQTLGSASLPVFCAHLVMVLMTLSIWGDNQYARPWWGDAMLLAGCFAFLTAVAEVTLWFDRAPVHRWRGLRGRRMRAAELPTPLTQEDFSEPPPPAPPTGAAAPSA